MCNSRAKFAYRYATVLLLALLLAHTPASSQNAIPEVRSASSPKPEGDNPVEAEENRSPEEVEDRKFYYAYERIHELFSCSPEIIGRYESEVIAPAEKSIYKIPKNKILFLTNQAIARCYLGRDYGQAEARYKKSMEYLIVWPGADDSFYPHNFWQIAVMQMQQQHWKDAEDSLNQSVSIFELQISRTPSSANESGQSRHFWSLVESKAQSISTLAVAYLREGRVTDALKTADLAYAEITRPHALVARTSMLGVLKRGTLIAQESRDEVSIAKWSQRSQGWDIN